MKNEVAEPESNMYVTVTSHFSEFSRFTRTFNISALFICEYFNIFPQARFHERNYHKPPGYEARAIFYSL